ncbi:MAG: Na+/H+ antiporter subunit E [Sphaerobacteraceae bacterium]|nr:MAG: Na+/H+ antiporter subunit E [Sphaerobacteraceae bacterium]
MNALLLNVFLALIWAAATGNFDPANLLVGFAIGFLVVVFAQRAVGSTNYGRKFILVVRFALFFIYELFKANLRVAYDVITPSQYMRPGVVAIPLSVKTDTEITLLANLISLTPGTLSLDVSDDKSVLYLHAMFVDDPDELRHEIKAGFERRVIEVLR